jgi:hypothetical protein
MHRSRLAGFIIDCRGRPEEVLGSAASFWSGALGMGDKGAEGAVYHRLDACARDMVIEVQAVDHESRLHLDIEADDVEAEVKRLEGLGAKRVGMVKTWCVMEAPTGQRFCVVRGKDLERKPGVNVWP